jgi:hypothetical protein
LAIDGGPIDFELVQGQQMSASTGGFVLLAMLACGEASDLAWTPGAAQDRAGVVAWTAPPDATSYTVTLRESVPNGRRLTTVQRSVEEPRFAYVPAAAGGPTKAVIEVVSHCRDGRRSAAASLDFVIERRTACAPPSGLAVAAGGAGARLDWQPSARADRYTLHALRLVDGQLVFSRETSRPTVELPPSAAPLMLQVTAHCGAVTSVPVHLVRLPGS